VKLKIAQVTPAFYPIIGGIELYALNLSKELTKRGYEVHVYTANRVMGEHITPPEQEVDGIKIHRLPVIAEFSYRLRFWPALYGRLIRDKPNIILVQGHDHPHSLTSILAGRRAHIPTIVITYGPVRNQAFHTAIGNLACDAYDNLITPLVFRLTNKVLAKYPQILPWIKSYMVSDERIGLAFSGIPEDCFIPRDGERFRKKHGIDGQVVLYVGRLSPQKGIKSIVATMPHVLRVLPKTTFVFIGPDYLNYKKTLLRLAKELKVDGNIRFIQPIYDLNEEMEAYAAADVFVMPSSFEGFSQAIHKAWAQSRPVIATNVGVLPYQVKHGKDGLIVEFADERSLADAIVTILQSSDLAKSLGNKGQTKARRYTYNILTDEMERTFEDLLANPNS